MARNNPNSLKILGKTLKTMREKQGLSLNLFAFKNDISSATVSRVENGLVDVKVSTLIKYAHVFNIPIQDIVMGIDTIEE